jgi:hypothetical protein
MSNKVIESYSNILRQDAGGATPDKHQPSDFNLNSRINAFPQLNLLCESSQTMIETSPKPSRGEGVENISVSCLNLHESYIDFFSLPKYGLVEQGCQTNLTGRDIEDQEHDLKEFRKFKSDFFLSISKGKPEEALKRLFPLLEDFKVFSKQKDLESLEKKKEAQNFIKIKRATEEELPFSNQRFLNIKSFKTHSENGFPHLHLNKVNTSGRRRRRKKHEMISNSPEKPSNKSDKVFSEFTPEISLGPKKDFNYEDDIAGIINHIKNSSSKQDKKVN